MKTNSILAAALVLALAAPSGAETPFSDSDAVMRRIDAHVLAETKTLRFEAGVRRLGFGAQGCYADGSYYALIGSGCETAKPSGFYERVMGTASPYKDPLRCAQLMLLADYSRHPPQRRLPGWELYLRGYADGSSKLINLGLGRVGPDEDAALAELSKLVAELGSRYGKGPSAQDIPRSACVGGGSVSAGF